jgi:hypothetical protein
MVGNSLTEGSGRDASRAGSMGCRVQIEAAMVQNNDLVDSSELIGTSASVAAAGEFARALALVKQTARNMFGLDYRSLALLRIGLALCLLWVAYANACEMRAFYTDDGVLPRAALFDNPGESLGFSLHFAHGGLPFIASLFVVQILLALMMLVGYRATLSTVGSYILLLSMQNRQPALIYGADIALREGLFWAIFLPLSRRYSLDRLAGRTEPAASRPYLGMAGIAFIVQVCVMYTGGALMKSGPTWTVDHTAVAYALAMDVFSRPLGQWLSQFAGVCRALTIITLYLELYGPVLFVLPVLSTWGRLLGIVLFAGLQIGFGLCMTMGIFGPVMITLSLVFLPPFFWERIGEPCGRTLANWFHGLAAAGSTGFGAWRRRRFQHERGRSAAGVSWTPPRGVRLARLVLAMIRDVALALLMVVMVLWNIGNIRGQPWRLVPALDTLAYTIGLNQRWDMFAPDPDNTDGWFVVAGILRNGQTVDLMTGASPVSYARPASVAGSYQSQMWMSYLTAFWLDDAPDPELFTRYLGTTWNENHSGDEQLESIEFSTMLQTVEPGPSKSAVTRKLIWIQRF